MRSHAPQRESPVRGGSDRAHQGEGEILAILLFTLPRGALLQGLISWGVLLCHPPESKGFGYENVWLKVLVSKPLVI